MKKNRDKFIFHIHTHTHTKGFTLIEILVVLIIVAIITAVAVMAFGHFGRGRREKMVVNQLVRSITVAQQQAILTPEVLGLGISNKGYRYYQLEFSLSQKQDVWKHLQDDALSQPNAFQKIFSAHVKSIAASEYTELKISDGVKPEIIFSPSGYVTPFVLELQGSSHEFTVTVKNNGVVKIKVISNQ